MDVILRIKLVIALDKIRQPPHFFGRFDIGMVFAKVFGTFKPPPSLQKESIIPIRLSKLNIERIIGFDIVSQ